MSIFGFCCENFVKKIILSSLFIFRTNLKPCPAPFPLQVQQRCQVPPWGKPSLAHCDRLVWPKTQPAGRNSSVIVLLLLWNGCHVVSCSFSNTAPIASPTILINVWRKGSLQFSCLQITKLWSFYTTSILREVKLLQFNLGG